MRDVNLSMTQKFGSTPRYADTLVSRIFNQVPRNVRLIRRADEFRIGNDLDSERPQPDYD